MPIYNGRPCDVRLCLLAFYSSRDPVPQSPTVGNTADEEWTCAVICPYNFVKTKLKLETMLPGQVLAVLLDAGEPIKSVPRSVSDDRHTVLSQERVEQSYRVRIHKHGAS